MKCLIALSVLFSITTSFASTCNVEIANKYVSGIELATSTANDGIVVTGAQITGKTITRTDIKSVSADSAYLVTVTNEAETSSTYGNYSKYLVTLKQSGTLCLPASIVLLGSSRNSGL